MPSSGCQKCALDRKSTRLNSSHGSISYAVFCLRTNAKRLQTNFAIIDKRRPAPHVAEIMNIIGDVAGKICIIMDDMIDTAGTIFLLADARPKKAAKLPYACCSH